jgi:hypothetical protein
MSKGPKECRRPRYEEDEVVNKDVEALFAARRSSDRDRAYEALRTLFRMTEQPVDWAYDVWPDLLDDLSAREGSTRAFAAQMLARLAISDPDGRMLNDFPRLASVMNDEKTVTARHTLQSLWRIGRAGAAQRELVVSAMVARFEGCADEKGARLVRRDVVAALGRLWRATAEASVRERADALVDAEPSEEERKKQRAAWQEAVGAAAE